MSSCFSAASLLCKCNETWFLSLQTVYMSCCIYCQIILRLRISRNQKMSKISQKSILLKWSFKFPTNSSKEPIIMSCKAFFIKLNFFWIFNFISNILSTIEETWKFAPMYKDVFSVIKNNVSDLVSVALLMCTFFNIVVIQKKNDAWSLFLKFNSF